MMEPVFGLIAYTLGLLAILLIAGTACGTYQLLTNLARAQRANHYSKVAVGSLLKPRKTLKQILRDAFAQIH